MFLRSPALRSAFGGGGGEGFFASTFRVRNLGCVPVQRPFQHGFIQGNYQGIGRHRVVNEQIRDGALFLRALNFE